MVNTMRKDMGRNMKNNMKKKQNSVLKLVKMRRGITPPPTKIFVDRVKKSSKNSCRLSKFQ